jgi:hypothetical protein
VGDPLVCCSGCRAVAIDDETACAHGSASLIVLSVCVCLYVSVSICVCLYVSVCVCLSVCFCLSVFVHLSVDMSVCLFVFLCVSVCLYVYLCSIFLYLSVCTPLITTRLGETPYEGVPPEEIVPKVMSGLRLSEPPG